jgi:phage tail sheath protein FI
VHDRDSLGIEDRVHIMVDISDDTKIVQRRAEITGVVRRRVLANPVCSALPGVLNKLIGMAVIGGPANSKQAFIDWRETLQSERLIPVASTVKITDANGVVQTRPSEGRVIGIGVRRDFEKNGKPFHSWANQPVQGIVGPNRFIEFSLTDGATEGQEILAANGGVILRGQYGVETAIASGGFVYVGTDTLSEDSLWQFYNVMRGRDYIHLMFLRTLRYYLGRFNLTGQTIQSVINTMEFALRDLKADNHILGYKVGFSKDQNWPEQLRLGK